MDKWIFIAETDFNDLDCKQYTTDITDEEKFKKVKEIFDKLKPIVNDDHKLVNLIDQIEDEQTDLFGNPLNDYEFEKYFDFLMDIIPLYHSFYDNTAHTLRSLRLIKIAEEL